MTVHIPILLNPIVQALSEPFRSLPLNSPPHTLVDCTLGGGGHLAAFLDIFRSDPKLSHHKILATDQDPLAITAARNRFAPDIANGRLTLVHCRFSELTPLLKDHIVFGLLADLGFSSDQLEDHSRGLSFMREGPLDMRLDPRRGQSCLEFLTEVTEEELAQVLFEFSEERFSRRIAQAIIQSRNLGQLPSTTTGLAALITRAVPPKFRHGRIHAATRSFQALRICVNQEIDELDCLLNHVILSLKSGGRVAILSFHSLEDRKVKQVFRDPALQFNQLDRKVIKAPDEEVNANPRARSAKLRIAEKLQPERPPTLC